MEQKTEQHLGMDKIYELRDEVENALKIAERLISEQGELCAIIKKTKGKKHDFKEFVKGLEDEIKGYKVQRDSLTERLAIANNMIKVYTDGHKEGATDIEKGTAAVMEKTLNDLFTVLKYLPTESEKKVQEETEALEKKNNNTTTVNA